MTTTDYPATLPRPQHGLGVEVKGATKQTARDRPQQRARVLGQQSQTIQSLSWIFRTDAQFAAFVQWWRYSLRNGTLAANMQLPNGYSDALQLVQFLGPYAATDLNNGWSVTATVELLSPPRMTGDDVLGLIAYGSLDISVDAAALHNVIHVTLPGNIP